MRKVISQELIRRHPKDAFNWLAQRPIVDRWILRMDVGPQLVNDSINVKLIDTILVILKKSLPGTICVSRDQPSETPLQNLNIQPSKQSSPALY